MSRNLDSIEAMEIMAQNEADNSCNKRMFGKWLEVVFLETSGKFTYIYDNRRITRDAAAALLGE